MVWIWLVYYIRQGGVKLFVCLSILSLLAGLYKYHWLKHHKKSRFSIYILLNTLVEVCSFRVLLWYIWFQN